MKKSECTPEQWEQYKLYHKEYHQKHKSSINERRRTVLATDEKKQKRREYEAKPEARAKRRARDNLPENLAKGYAWIKQPDRWEAKLETQRVKRTGFTKELFKAVLKHQENKCAICGKSFDNAQARRDHCHDTGKPRGILCLQCNLIEGHIRSLKISPQEFFSKLEHYLTCPPASLVK